ncbi:MAG: ACP S-malonyltransferase [Oligoflexia bacterium]|nr:ACP S-malonyltransferase [Oligoflexia bacterium]
MKSVFIFPGQGSQYVGMGKSLYDNFSVAKQIFEEANDALSLDLKKICFDGPESDLRLTQNTQPAILCHSIAAYNVMINESEIKPAYVAGHSLGEYSALVASKALRFSDAIRLVQKRGQFMQEAVPVGTGAMAALVGATEESAKIVCQKSSEKTAKVCEVANYNGGGQIVISGHKEAIDEAVDLASKDVDLKIARAVPLQVSAPFHCSLMKAAEEKMLPLLKATSVNSLEFAYIANVDAEVYSASDRVVDCLIRQICGSVRWEQSMTKLAALEVSTAYEIGPGKVLSGLMRRINRELKTKAVDVVDDIRALS